MKSSILVSTMLFSASFPSSSFALLTRRRISTQVHRSWSSTYTSRSAEAVTSNKIVNLHTIPLNELEEILKSWGHPKYRAKQINNWVRQGCTDVNEMNNLPQTLRADLEKFATIGSLSLDCELISKDGTKKRAYRLADGQLIESVLMPYSDGRYTACISSQAGCAQGCVFCATGQMGFSRQLTPEEIYEQVSIFSAELALEDKEKKKSKKNGKPQQSSSGRATRLSNIVFMGMGEPLANYRNVKSAVQRIQSELGIGHRKITISTVGIVPNIYKMAEDLPQVRLAVSLHCADDKERTELLPANKRYGGLDELMLSLQEYIATTRKRVTLEWALIEGENDTPETAHQLGKLIKKWLRRDMVHVNVIPLNPTGGYGGSPSGRKRVDTFVRILEDSYGVACTPRMRRGIDINAGCGQLKAEVEKRNKDEAEAAKLLTLGDEEDEVEEESQRTVDFVIDENHIQISEEEDWNDYEYTGSEEKEEAARLISLLKGTVITAENQIVGLSKEQPSKP